MIRNGQISRRPHRSPSAAFKTEVALNAVKGDKTPAEVAQKHDAHPSRLKSGAASCRIVPPMCSASAVPPWQPRTLSSAAPRVPREIPMMTADIAAAAYPDVVMGKCGGTAL